MHVTCIIVTYGNRFNFLYKVIAACLREKADKILIVDNNSSKESLDEIMGLVASFDEVSVLRLNENTGSSGGYKAGLELVFDDSESEYIWLLDDDNIPQEGALGCLKDSWSEVVDTDDFKFFCLLGDRENRAKPQYRSRDRDFMLGRKNSFLSMHIFSLPEKILNRLTGYIFKDTRKISESFNNVSVASYGGLFFNKEILKLIGFPNDRYFVYSDDHEWTYRITKNNGKIFIVNECKISDIDYSWDSGKNGFMLLPLIDSPSSFRVYYSVRNKVNFQFNSYVDNKIIFYINMSFYLFILFSYAVIKGRFSRIGLIVEAVSAGLRGNLGKNNRFS